MRLRRLLAALLLECLCALAGAQSTTSSYALRGTLIMPEGIVENGTVLVEQGKIAAAGAHVRLPAGVAIVDTHGIVAPGLVDLHNHLTWNVFPRWRPIEEFGSRYDWQQKPVYRTLVESPHAALVSDGYECAMERYAEVKALSQGETAVVGSLREPCSKGLTRNLDAESEWGVTYNVFPFQMPDGEVQAMRERLAHREHVALLIHVAEGAPRDASAAREFAMLKARGLLMPGVSLIHGVALKPADFAEMAAHGVGLIWSPRSNVELYGDTADVAAARGAGVSIALAPDWSPTGSDGLLAELNYAAAWNSTQSPPLFTNRELFSMATVNAAALVGQSQRLGALAAGHDADLLVLAPGPAGTAHDAYWALTHADASEVALVIVDGAPLYGDLELLRQLGPARPPEALTVCGVTKGLVLGGAHGGADAADQSWAQTETSLAHALAHRGRRLAPLAECGQ